MLATIVIIYSILIFPIILNGNISFDKSKKRINYYVKLFGLIKVLYGYFELDDEGIIIHLTKKKAILIKFSDLLSIRSKFKPLRDYHLLKFKSKLEVGAYDNRLSIELVLIYNVIMQELGLILTNTKPYFEFKNTINLYEDSNEFKYICDVSLVFNLLMVIISALKIILEKIIYAIKCRRQQNKRYN